MSKLSDATKAQFLKFYFREQSFEKFSDWLYSASNLEDEVGEDFYLALIEPDLRDPEGIEKTRRVVLDIYNETDKNAIFKDRARSIAKSMLANRLTLPDGCRLLAHISADRNKIVDTVFISYADEFDRLGKTNFYNARIIGDLQKLLKKLEE